MRINTGINMKLKYGKKIISILTFQIIIPLLQIKPIGNNQQIQVSYNQLSLNEYKRVIKY